MALVFCTQCKNEYDDYTNACPYCGKRTSAMTSSGRKKIAFIIFAAGALLVGDFLLNNESDLKTQAIDLYHRTTSSGPYAPAEYEEATVEATLSALEQEIITISPDTTTAPVVTASPGTVISSSTPALTNYVKKTNQLLTTHAPKSGLQLPAGLLSSADGRTFTYSISESTALAIQMNKNVSQVQSITIYDKHEPGYASRMRNISSALVAAIMPKNISVDDVDSQLVYLQQMALANKGKMASYKFEGFYLASLYDPVRRSLTIAVSTESISSLRSYHNR